MRTKTKRTPLDHLLIQFIKKILGKKNQLRIPILVRATVHAVPIAALLFACSHGPVIQEYPDTASPSEEVTKLDIDVDAAAKNQLDVLSPDNFKETQGYLNDAKDSLSKQEDAKTTLHYVALARGYLNRANEFALVSRSNLEEVMAARKQAISAGARESQSKAFQKTEKRLVDATSDIESNDTETALDNRSELQMDYLDLELLAIKQARLGPARATIAQAVKEGAKEFASRSLAIADKNVEDADAFITANRHDVAQISLRSNRATTSADHLLKITRDAQSATKTSPEELALKIETEQNRVENTTRQLEAKEGQLDSKQRQLSLKEATNQALTAENSTLESEREFNQRFERAREEFTPDEAEVYKQGDTLLIRLKGLEFPVAQSVLRSDNFALLAKVQKVIDDFGQSSVTVEGHTDSIGGKSMNEKLSLDRAEAVREYFMANTRGEPLHVRAVGLDYQKPLANNKTASGRAQNRRVDVLIRADSSAATTTTN